MKPDLEEFSAVVAETFLQHPGPLTGDIRFRDLPGWNSLQALLVVAALDEHYRVALPEPQFRKAHTIAELHQLVVNSTAA